MMAEEVIKVENIRASYGKREVLFGISLRIKEKESLLLIGPNGSGKSTLLKIMAGLLRQKEGRIFLDSEDISHKTVEERVKKGISYLPQTNNIFPALTVEENLQMSCMDLQEEEFKDRMKWVVDVFPILRDKTKERAGLLSGGERQALATGMALIKKSSIVLLDEPTAGLAPVAANTVLKGIEKAKKEREFSMIIVEHNLKQVTPWVDRVVGLRGGEIVFETDNPKEVLEQRDKVEEIFFGKVS